MARTFFSTIETAIGATANGKTFKTVTATERDYACKHFMISKDLSRFEMPQLPEAAPQLALEPMVS